MNCAILAGFAIYSLFIAAPVNAAIADTLPLTRSTCWKQGTGEFSQVLCFFNSGRAQLKKTSWVRTKPTEVERVSLGW